MNSCEIAWRLRVQPTFGATAVRRIRASQVEDWIAELSTAGLSASKVIETYGVLKRLLDRAVRDRALPKNPCVNRSTRLPRHTAKDRPVLSPAEVGVHCTRPRRHGPDQRPSRGGLHITVRFPGTAETSSPR